MGKSKMILIIITFIVIALLAMASSWVIQQLKSVDNSPKLAEPPPKIRINTLIMEDGYLYLSLRSNKPLSLLVINGEDTGINGIIYWFNDHNGYFCYSYALEKQIQDYILTIEATDKEGNYITEVYDLSLFKMGYLNIIEEQAAESLRYRDAWLILLDMYSSYKSENSSCKLSETIIYQLNNKADIQSFMDILMDLQPPEDVVSYFIHGEPLAEIHIGSYVFHVKDRDSRVSIALDDDTTPLLLFFPDEKRAKLDEFLGKFN